MSRKFFAEHNSLNSKPMSLIKIFVVGYIFAYFLGIASSEVASVATIGINIIILIIVNHHLGNNYDNIEILALQIEKLQAQQENNKADLTNG